MEFLEFPILLIFYLLYKRVKKGETSAQRVLRFKPSQEKSEAPRFPNALPPRRAENGGNRRRDCGSADGAGEFSVGTNKSRGWMPTLS